jgi:acetyl esterase/lipase
MEIYFPPNHDPAKAKVPGVILFHGGAWGGGSLSQFRVACAYFASRGLVCATAEYQMLSAADAKKLPAGETRKRVCVTDAKGAIRWLKQHATELGIDPNRIITGGGSAGGHISALATLNPGLNDPADPKDIDTSVVAYLWFNPAFALDDDKDAEIDVLRYVKSGLAPAIVFFGDQDGWKKGWDIAHAKWKSLGNQTIDLQIAPGQSHSFFNKDPWQTLTLIAADRFLVKLGLLTGEPTKTAPASEEKLVPADGK